MKLILVSSPAMESPEAMDLGAASVAAAVVAAGASSPGGGALSPLGFELFEARTGEAAEDLAARLAVLASPRAGAPAPGFVGFSVYSWNRGLFVAASRALRARLPSTVQFAGGPEATAAPESLLGDSSLDFVVAGEGESTVVEALRALLGGNRDALAEIPGVVLPGRPWSPAPAEDPARLPSPWLLGAIDPASNEGDVVWELSRGCPFRCAYCYESKGRAGARPFPLERIEAELELFARSGVRYAFVLDPTFDSDPARASALLDLFARKAPGIRFKFEARAELLDRRLVRRFASLDCMLQIGLQSARAETLALVGRPGFDRKEYARRIGMLSSSGVTFGLDLIYGLPGDGLADFRDSLDFALGLGPNNLDVFPLALLPGTGLADRAVELGIEADPEPPYLVRGTRELPPGDLAAAAALAAAADRFYTEGRAVGWFAAVRRPLRRSPSELLGAFAAWSGLGGAPLGRRGWAAAVGPRAVMEEQLGFLGEEYARSGLNALLPALRDLVKLHGAWGLALAEGEESELDLSYDPEEVLACAPAGLAAFAASASRSPGSWLVTPDDEEGARLERVGRPGRSRGPRRPAGRPRVP